MSVDVKCGSSAPKVDISDEQDGGILKQIKREAKEKDGKPLKGDKVKVHYVGTLEDGTKFDSSRDRSDFFTFDLGKGQVIKGWDVGVASMYKGEVAVFYLKPEYGYGKSGSPPKIPGNATLIFEIELFDFTGEDVTKDKDGGVMKRVFEAGEGLDHPNDGGMVEVEIKASCQGKVFDERTEKFNIGEGADSKFPLGLETGLMKMKKGERAEITMTPSYGFGSAGLACKGVPANASLVYNVKLTSFERAKESWQLDGDQKLEQSRLFKEKGTAYFSDGNYEQALKKYAKIVEYLEHEISLKDEKEEERKSLLQAGRLNLAMCHLKQEEWIEARNVCDKVIAENPASEKGYFRRGEAKMKLNDHSMAKEDFVKCLELDKENTMAKKRVAMCQQLIKVQMAKEKRTFANMFDKFAEADAKKEEMAKLNKKPLEINEWSGKDPTSKVNSDPNNITVSGDINMDIDLNKEISAATDGGGVENGENVA